MEKKYYRHKIENLLVINRIITIHYFEFAKNFYFKEEAHDFWEIVYADKESILCTADDEEMLLKEGEILFHKPNERHSLRANGKSAPNVFIISFECKSEAVRFFENRKLTLDTSLLRFVYALIEESKKTFHMHYSDPELKKMSLLDKPTLGGQQLIKNYLEILLVNLMRNETEKENPEVVFLPHEKLGEQVAKQVVTFLKEHIHERLEIADICLALNYNKSYIFEQFKKATGRSVMAYFIRLKTERAKRFLRETEMSVTQIADALAFDTPNYFSKTFKKITGYTPLQYKKIHRR
ncbi:MAG: AraC family transcriptional regulator [Clostridia bacterium]|nr:AraC family transcriptional regulator [Clostridia bacterium]